MIGYGDWRLADEAGRHLAFCFARIDRRSGKVSMYEERFNKAPLHDRSLMRTFGCLGFAKIKNPNRGYSTGSRSHTGE